MLLGRLLYVRQVKQFHLDGSLYSVWRPFASKRSFKLRSLDTRGEALNDIFFIWSVKCIDMLSLESMFYCKTFVFLPKSTAYLLKRIYLSILLESGPCPLDIVEDSDNRSCYLGCTLFRCGLILSGSIDSWILRFFRMTLMTLPSFLFFSGGMVISLTTFVSLRHCTIVLCLHNYFQVSAIGYFPNVRGPTLFCYSWYYRGDDEWTSQHDSADRPSFRRTHHMKFSCLSWKEWRSDLMNQFFPKIRSQQWHLLSLSGQDRVHCQEHVLGSLHGFEDYA